MYDQVSPVANHGQFVKFYGKSSYNSKFWVHEVCCGSGSAAPKMTAEINVRSGRIVFRKRALIDETVGEFPIWWARIPVLPPTREYSSDLRIVLSTVAAGSPRIDFTAESFFFNWKFAQSLRV